MMNWHLTVDAGNSEITQVLYRGESRLAALRSQTRPYPSAQALLACWTQLLDNHEFAGQPFLLTISSVVPTLESDLRGAAQALAPAFVHWVDWGSPHPFRASTSASAEIGADLIAGLAAARKVTDGPFVVVDCGTATTLTVVGSDNFIHGVAILPGMVTQLKSLTHSAPHLPQDITLQPPPLPFGNNTEESLQSGILYGHASAIEGLLSRYRARFEGESMTAFGCGGLFHRIADLCPSVGVKERELVNLGCRVLGERASEVGAACHAQEGF